MDIINYEEILPEYFSMEAEIKTWANVEGMLAEVQGELSQIPAKAAKKIALAAEIFECNLDQLLEKQKKIGHPFVPFLRAFEKECGNAGDYLHFGATTQNIEHNGFMIRMHRAQIAIDKKQNILLDILCKLAEKHKNTIMIGRTHSQQALPITFGYKVASWIDEFQRHLERQKEVKTRFFTAMMGGAVGSFASFAEYGRKVQDGMARKMGMKSMPVPNRAIYDSYAEYISVLALSCSTIGRIAADLRFMMRTEVGEVFLDDGTVGSSTMPHKRNPLKLTNLLYATKKSNSLLCESFDAMVFEDEGNRFGYEIVSNNLVKAFKLNYFSLDGVIDVLDTLKINEDKMKFNLTITNGWIMAEPLMLKLSNKIGKTNAHKILHTLAIESKESMLSLKEVSKQNKELSKIDITIIENALNPKNYIGECVRISEEIVQNMLKYQEVK